jgi:hypothetical protein
MRWLAQNDTMASDVIGHGQELAAVAAFLAGVESGPRALVFSGEAGIGNTFLWETGVHEAEERFGRVLTCRGVEAEATLSFAGLSELLGPVLEEVAPALLPPRRRALEIALLIAEPGDAPPEPHAIGLAVLDVLRIVAEQGPLLVALDDAQWLDPASAAALQLALRRLRSEPIGLLMTVREAPGVAEPFDRERLLPPGRLVRLRLRPLGVLWLHELLKGRLGLELVRPEPAELAELAARLDEDFARACVGSDTRPGVDSNPSDLPVEQLALARVQACPHFKTQRLYALDDPLSAADRARRDVEAGEEPVARRFTSRPRNLTSCRRTRA